jgi:hypothetical protein
MKKKILILVVVISLFASQSGKAQTATALTCPQWAVLNLNALDQDWTFSAKSFLSNSTNSFPMVDNANAVMTLNLYPGNVNHQLGFNGSGDLFERFNRMNSGTWFKMFSERNLNRGDVDFSAKNIYATGKIGINRTNPSSELDISGNITTRENNTGMGMQIFKTGIYGNAGGFADIYVDGNIGVHLSAYSGAGASYFLTTRLGIGTTNPDATLTVKGTIHAQEVKVDLAVPADFVFESDYKLMPLAEVEKYVKAQKHLPEIPSGKTIKENGLNMGEMQNKLLQKVEELTLYTIEQDKQIQVQNKKLEEQDKKNADLQQKIEKLEGMINQKLK